MEGECGMVRDVKQASFRLNADDTEKFKAFCEESEMTAAQGFSVLLEVMELDRAGRALPARKTEIEHFEQLTKSMVSAFLHSLELNENAEHRMREQFSAQLESQNRTISDYQVQISHLQLKLEEAVNFAESYRNDLQITQDSIDELSRLRFQAEQNYAALKEEKEKQLSDKENIIAMLTDKLMTAEQKAAGYNELEAQNATLTANLSIAEQTIKDNAKDAKIEQERALNALEREKDKEQRALQDRYAVQISDLQQALLDSERKANEQIRTLDKEISELREKIVDLKSKKQTTKQQSKKSQ